MSDEGYNGWKNYPTWAVHLWLTNDEATYDHCHSMAYEAKQDGNARWALAENLKGFVRDENEPAEASLRGDLLGYALDCVDWYEVADAFLSEQVPA